MACFIIAEAGVNHNGDIQLAEELVYAAKDMGADAIKFQTFKAENLVNLHAQKAEYQTKNTGSGTQFEMLKALELSFEQYQSLSELAAKLQLEFMSTGFDEQSVDFLVSLGVKRLKIPSGELTNFPLLMHMARTKLPLIISTGMSYLAEVEQVVSTLLPINADITLLHCTSNYPAHYNEVNLLAMKTLAERFGLPVGYSDHTLGTIVPLLAIAMGASVLEKHFTLDTKLPGPDHAASMMPADFADMIKYIRDAEMCLGNGVKEPGANEYAVRNLVRRSICAKHPLQKGLAINEGDLVCLRPGTGIPPAEAHNIIGRRLNINLDAGSTIQWEHLMPL